MTTLKDFLEVDHIWQRKPDTTQDESSYSTAIYYKKDNEVIVGYGSTQGNADQKALEALDQRLLAQVREMINPDEIAERIVIEYANESGREDQYRTFVRSSARKVLSDLLSLLTDTK